MLQIEAVAAAQQAGADAIREPILHWLESKRGAPLPADAWSGQPFETAPDQGPLAQAAGHPDPLVWAIRLIDPDREIPGRNWITEAALFAADSSFRFATRLSCSTRGEIADFVPASPSFIRQLAGEVGLSNGDQPLAAVPKAIVGEPDVDHLVAAIGDSQRRLPVIVVSAPSDSATFLVDPTQLAENLVGLATVYSISFDAALLLTRKVGKSWSVFLGAIRIYTPYSNSDRKTPYDHPLLFADQLKGASEGWGLSWLCRQAARISVQRDDLFRLLPAFDRIKADIEQREIGQRLRVAAAPGERESLLHQQNEALKGDAEAALQLANENEHQALEARQQLAEAREQHTVAQSRIRQLEAALRSSGLPIPPEPPPYWYGGLAEWAERNFAGRLVLSKKAQRAVEDSDYADIALVGDGLALLANEYVDMRRAGGGRDQYEKRLAELRLGDERIAADPQRVRNEPQYWCSYQGRDIFTDRHLKKGNSRDPRECLRIYYAWDEPTKQVIIGHLTTHLETEIT